MARGRKGDTEICNDAAVGELRDLGRRLGVGTVTRRQLLGRAAALGISATALSSLLPRVTLAQETPKRGGHLKVGLDGAGTSDSLDPASYTVFFMEILGQQLYSQLVEVDEKGQVQPALAESWEAKPGATEWRFKLRKDVVFHNGKKLTAADVVYTLNYHRGKDSKSAARSLLEPVADVKADGDSDVVITLNGGNADLPYLLADYHLCIGPEGTNFRDGIGTGAYALETFNPGVRAMTKKNPNFWRTDRGFVDSVETIAINDPTARLSALLSGAVHLINRADPKSAKLIADSPHVQLYNAPSGGHPTFAMRCDTGPFQDNNLRLAMKYAIDREDIIRRAMLGFATVGNDTPVPSFDPVFAADIPQRPYDPDKAKFYFQKANPSAPITLDVCDGAFAGAVEAAQLFQASAAKAGITVQVSRDPNDGYWENVWRKVPFCASFWSPRPTADMIFSIAYRSDAPWNETYWKRPDFDKLLIEARAELDQAKRKQMYHDLQLMVYEDGGELVPMFVNLLDAGRSEVKGFVPSPRDQMSGLRAPERVWLES